MVLHLRNLKFISEYKKLVVSLIEISSLSFTFEQYITI